MYTPKVQGGRSRGGCENSSETASEPKQRAHQKAHPGVQPGCGLGEVQRGEALGRSMLVTWDQSQVKLG